jgi:two-component system, OmpR family, response regulator MtrA
MSNTLLVVEDDSALLNMLGIALRSTGHSTVLSSDAESALERLPDESPDIILCDVNLPGMNGAEFTKAIKSSQLVADTPMILMSAYDEPKDHAADAFVRKPFDPGEVIQLVDEKLAWQEQGDGA